MQDFTNGIHFFNQWREIVERLVTLIPQNLKYQEWNQIQYELPVEQKDEFEDVNADEGDMVDYEIQDLINTGDYYKSLKLLDDREEVARQSIDPRGQLLEILEDRAQVYKEMKKFESALDCFEQREKVLLSLNNTEGYIDNLLSMAEIVHEFMNNTDSAISLLKEAISLSEDKNLKDLLLEARQMLDNIEN